MEETIIRGPLNEEKIKKISEILNEPDWMTNIRLIGLNYFNKLDLPNFGPEINNIDFDNMIYYRSIIKENKPKRWEDLPEEIRNRIEKLGLRKEFEREFLSGLLYQHDSSSIYKEIKKYLDQEGVIFMPLSQAVIEYPEIVKEYFGKIVSFGDNKFAALNTAVWSGGVFIYVPENVKIDFPLQAYFWIGTENLGQFERTLIIADKNSRVTYIEGCTAPIYNISSLHAAVVEAFAKENSEVTYATVQNWSRNVYNLVTKRARAYKNAKIKWISAEFGSKVTMLYPGLILEENSVGEIYTISIANENQIIDTGGRILINGKNSNGYIVTKSISINGKAVGRIDIKIFSNSENSKVISKCDSLIEGNGIIESIPRIEIYNKKNYYNHEAKTEKIDDQKVFYLQSLGIDKKKAKKLIYTGFADDILKNFPPSYQIRIKKLLEIELEEIGGFG
ncbi:MAG: Fe-S cluster assembly protein SufB [Candidatus Nanopusillus sp.]